MLNTYPSRTPCSSILPSLPRRIQAASFVRVAKVISSLEAPSYGILVKHRLHPDAAQPDKKLFELDFVFEDDEGVGDVCWRFQFAKDEDIKEQLWAWAMSFGDPKHRSDNEDYEPYVQAFCSMAIKLGMDSTKGSQWYTEDDEDD